ncbi:YdgH/BhsA/McbA-like domain containing protein [Ewingella americana]|uniref:YdgH/BhsA/McbA-like domain containing protein n=1 Tax=Ewingella americana TaxID=41202 RepID=UPI0012AE44D2|nr:YdgH/BhsA/McbA-like domain containing protein [Ewingella americana]MRT05951.1 DUF1471 domain-containing protein [Ewingella americana]
MKYFKTTLAALLLSLCAFQATAAESLMQADTTQTVISTQTIAGKASNPGFIESQVQDKAKQLNASKYYIHNISGDNYLHATVTFYQ